MFFSVALISVFVLCIFYFYSQLKNIYLLYKSVKKVPGPKTVPIIGDLDLIRYRCDIIAYVEKYSTKFPLFKTWLGPFLFVVVSDVDVIKKIYASPQMNQRPMKELGAPNGLIESKYAMWRIHRKIINPTFSSKNVLIFLPTFIDNSREMVKKLVPCVGGTEFDLMDEVLKCGVMNILDNMYGLNTRFSEEMKISSITKYIQELGRLAGQRMCDPLLKSDFLYQLTTDGRHEKTVRRDGYAFLNPMVDERRALYMKEVVSDAENIPSKFIDLLLSHRMTDVEVKDELITMLAAGSETTAVSVCNAILLLAMHTKVQEKLAMEIDDFFSCNETITSENVNQIEYLDMVIKESLRLFSPIALIMREPIVDCDLGPFTVKPGTIVVVNLFSLLRDPKNWGDDAELFNPERFSPGNKANVNLQAYLPFGGGQRNCIGQRYANISVKVMLIHLLKAYKFSTDLKLKDLKFTFTVSLRLTNKHLVTMEAR